MAGHTRVSSSSSASIGPGTCSPQHCVIEAGNPCLDLARSFTRGDGRGTANEASEPQHVNRCVGEDIAPMSREKRGSAAKFNKTAKYL